MKLMSVFLTLMILLGSVSLKNLESSPVYENPVIVKHDGLQGRKVNVALDSIHLKASQNAGSFDNQKNSLRNDLVRKFSLAGLEKFVDHLSKENINSLSNNAEIQNLNQIRTLSIEMQKGIHETCGKISELMKLLHLKLNEIHTLDDKMKVLTPGSFKKAVKSIQVQQAKLKKAMTKEKITVQKVMNSIQKKQTTLIKALAVYDKKFATKNQTQLKDLLTSVNLQLKPQMGLPYFKQAYSQFMSLILSGAKNFSVAQLRNFQKTAADLIAKYWKGILEKAKAAYEKAHHTKNKVASKLNKKAKKAKQNKKKSPIKRIK